MPEESVYQRCYILTKREILDMLERIIPDDALVVKPALGGAESKAVNGKRRLNPVIKWEHIFAPDMLKEGGRNALPLGSMRPWPLYWFTKGESEQLFDAQTIQEKYEEANRR